MRSGAVVEFSNAAIETLQEAVARELGFRLVGHKLELYAVPLEITSKTRAKSQKTPAAKRSNPRRSG
jgi:Fe2+ or Zn2+ uptake regulation protein